METNIHTPKELFVQPVCYIIPPFQRSYVWSQEDQWEPLWDDVRNVAESYLEEMERSGGDVLRAQAQTPPHFLGAVVLQQVPRPAKFITQREVIDGQQRVTTIQLLLDAIQYVCEDLGFKPAATRLSMLVLNNQDLIGNESDELFKLKPTKLDREAFRHAMHNGLAVNDFEDSLIVQAHNFFQQQVRTWIENVPGSQNDNVDALETAVTTMLQMVVIDLSTKDDPNVIFETLNARGTPLEQSDLIKNFVLSELPDNYSGNSDIWAELDDRWWREEVVQGRLARPKLDMLLNYWLSMRTGTDVGHSKVFDMFRHFTSERCLEEVMSVVKRDLSYYRSFMTEERMEQEDLFYYRIFEVMKTGVVTPVLLLLLSAESEARKGALRALESFFVRRMICRQSTRDYSRLALELATRLRESGLDNATEVVAGFLKEQTAYSREWPTDETVAASLETSPLYRLLTRGRLRVVLEGIESQLRSPKAEQPHVPKNLTIEHLMPVGWQEEKWPLPEGIDRVTSTETRNHIVHSVGNLTLVNQRLNSSMSNDSWESKRVELLEHSVMALNSELTAKNQWNEDSILARSRRMGKLIIKCWPGPDSNEWGL